MEITSAIRHRKVEVGDLIDMAGGLKSEQGENPEYDRALVELVTEAAGFPMGEGIPVVAEALGIPLMTRGL